jgi:hypothetical protein
MTHSIHIKMNTSNLTQAIKQIINFAGSISVKIVLIATFLSPIQAQAQKQKDIEIFVNCVEYIGDGKYIANFGYDNPNKTSITVPDTNSILIFNNGKSKSKALNNFISGKQNNVFSKEFTSEDRVTWLMVHPDKQEKIVTASKNSSHCRGSGIIVPYYTPPEGGKITSLIGAELTALFELYMASGSAESDDIFQIDGNRVLVEITALEGQYQVLLELLKTTAYGLTVVTENEESLRITGLYPIGNLLMLNDLDNMINFVRPVYPSIGNNTGLGINLGDYSIRSDFARGGYNLSGENVKVGVLSNSYDTQGDADIDVGNGDLPGETNPYFNLTPVEVLKEYSVTFGSLSDEGRAMLQIVHDIAPGAELAFRTGSESADDFADGIRELADAGCDIIVDDITYVTEPFFRDGVVAEAVDQVTGMGIAYFSAAGNFGHKSYQSIFMPEEISGGITAHNFDGGDVYQSISLGEGIYMIVLQWDNDLDPDPAITSIDLDISLINEDGSELMGFNRINTGGAPLEILPFRVLGGSASTNIMVSKASGPDNVNFKYIVFRGPDIIFNEYGETGNSTIVGQANALGAMAVGAVLYSNTPAFGVDPPTIASFSSTGGTPVAGSIRQKPDFTAPNGVEATVKMSDFDHDGDGIFNFHGTSAAAPHAAAIAALLKEAMVRFEYLEPSPDEIRELLRSTALDMEIDGFDHISGYGFIQADAALSTFASPTPVINELIVPEGIVPGTAEFSLTVDGDYLSESSVVLFRGGEIPTEPQSDTALEAQIPVFTGNPEIQVRTPPKSTSQLDGGISNSLYFFAPVKKTVTVTALDYTKKYAEQLPEYSASILVDGIPLEQAGLLDDEYARLSGIGFLSNASNTSDVGTYKIIPDLDPPLHSDDEYQEIDIIISEKYEIEFIDGKII